MTQKTPQEQCQQTLQMMQCGTLDLQQLIKYGILLLGKTKAGKTTTSHYLTHQVLQGGYNDQNYVVYKLKQIDRRYASARIGDLQNKSQTRIPNVFQFMNDTQQTHLIDCPGYLDTFGFYRIISNRFFHYQVFSKVQNVKFIITFTFTDLRRSADIVKQTFRQFLTGFANLSKIKQHIFDATCVIVTNVPKNTQIQTVVNTYQKSQTNIGDDDINQIYKQLQQNIVSKKKLFIFHAAQLGKMCQTDNTLLKEISSSTKFWERKLVNNNRSVDMSHINLSLTKYIQKSKNKFKSQLNCFQKYYQSHIQSVFRCFKQILQKLTSDTQKGQQGNQFMELVIKQIQQKNKQRQQSKNQQYKYLYQKYKSKRQKLQQYLFNPKDPSQSSTPSMTDLPYWASKFTTFQHIQKIITNTQDINKKFKDKNSDKQQHQLIQFCSSINKIMKLILTLAKSKKLNQKKQKNKNSYFIQYAYQLYKDIQISNKMWRMSCQSKSGQPTQISNFVQENLTFILVKYPTVIRTMILKTIKITSFQLLPRVLQKIQLNTGLTKKAATCIQKIFQSHQKAIKQDKTMEINEKQDLQRKMTDLLVKVRNNSLQFLGKNKNPNLINLEQMQNHRKKIYQQIKQCRFNAYQNQNLRVENNKIIMLMAECLFKNNRYQLAKQLYDKIFNGHKVLQIYQKQQTEGRKNDYLNYLIKYMHAAKKYRRCEKALQLAQQAYNQAMHQSKKKQVTTILTFIKDILKGGCCRNFNDPYAQFLFEQVPDVDLPQQLTQKISKEASIAKQQDQRKKKKEQDQKNQKNAKKISAQQKKKTEPQQVPSK